MTLRVLSFLFLFHFITVSMLTAQGPPLLVEKPIMLGQNRSELRLFGRIEEMEIGHIFRSAHIGYDIVVNNYWSIGAAGSYWYNSNIHESTGHLVDGYQGFGDVNANIKYQFLRVDKIGKTYRMLAKIRQTFPTGTYKNNLHIGTNQYDTQISWIGGFESLKYGLLHELGYNYSTVKNGNYAKFDLGFGIPLLRSKVPINQLNLYFEYQSKYFPFDENDKYLDNFEAYFANGIQWAYNNWALEALYQWPLYRVGIGNYSKKNMLQAGIRLVL